MLNKIRSIHFWTGSLVLIACLGAGSRADADTFYSYFYEAGQSTYTATPGSDVQIPLYLQEKNSDGSSSSLLANELGLSAAGLSVTAAPSSPASITALVGNGRHCPAGSTGK